MGSQGFREAGAREQCPGLLGRRLRKVLTRGAPAETNPIAGCYGGGESEADSTLTLCSLRGLSLTLRGRGNSFTKDSDSTSCGTLVTLPSACVTSVFPRRLGTSSPCLERGRSAESSGSQCIAITFLSHARIPIMSIHWPNNFSKEGRRLFQKVLDLQTGFL